MEIIQNTVTVEMAKAIAEFQAKCPEISLDGEVSFGGRKFKYATLPNIVKTTQPALTAAGLTVIQPIVGGVIYTYVVCTKDGSMLTAWMALPERLKLQDTGSDITYCRRYMYVSLLGIVGEEDKDAENLKDIPAKGAPAKPAVPKKAVMTAEAKEAVMAKIANGKKGSLDGDKAKESMTALRGMFTMTEDDERDILSAIEMKILADTQ
jgi:hypothetical protein